MTPSHSSAPLIRIGVVIDSLLFRKSIVSLLLEKKDTYRITLEGGEKEAIPQISSLQENDLPQVILTAATLHSLNNSEAIKYIRTTYDRKIRIVLIALQNDLPLMPRLVNLGISAYLPPDTRKEDLFPVIKITLSKGYCFPDNMTGDIARALQEGYTDPEKVWKTLSPPEKEFLRLLCTDLPYREIAEKLSRSGKTVAAQRDELFRKFAVDNRYAMILLLLKNKLVEL